MTAEIAAILTVPGRLRVDSTGRLRGPANITYNTPWPTPNGRAGGFSAAQGGVIHTEVGYEHTVIHEFNDPSFQASAFCSIGMDAHIHQYGPILHGASWMAWTQVDGNPHWRGVEHADAGNPGNPMTDQQLWASAQVFEAMSTFDGWPLQATDDPVSGRGLIFHSDGAAAWGGHDCPGSVRRAQRPVILSRALQVRQGQKLASGSTYKADGVTSLLDLAERQGCTIGDLWFATAKSRLASGLTSFGGKQEAYLVAARWSVPLERDTYISVP
jgi:hypothetical protein